MSAPDLTADDSLFVLQLALLLGGAAAALMTGLLGPLAGPLASGLFGTAAFVGHLRIVRRLRAERDRAQALLRDAERRATAAEVALALAQARARGTGAP